jgi:hypothetical protein
VPPAVLDGDFGDMEGLVAAGLAKPKKWGGAKGYEFRSFVSRVRLKLDHLRIKHTVTRAGADAGLAAWLQLREIRDEIETDTARL